MFNSQLIDILLLAMVAGFVLFRLYTVLGRRTGNERPPQDRYRLEAPAPRPAGSDNVMGLPDRSAQRAEAGIDKPSDPTERALFDIKLADRNFDSARFLSGARQAYELIVTAFARGDRDALKPLLSKEVFAAFEAVIAEREKRQVKLEFTFIGLKSTTVREASLKGRMAEIVVSFSAQFISATRDASGTIVDGDPKTLQDVTDVWTFERDIKASDPNWTLVSTSGEEPVPDAH